MTIKSIFSGTNFLRTLSVSTMVVVAGCSPSSVKHRPTMIQPISNSAQFDDVVALLVDGKVDAARKLLSAMAKRDPSDQRTAALAASLNADPQVALGSKSFAYRVQPGDRMTALSQRFLGDRLKFYLLSRYNGIAIPAQLSAGQMLRIPGVAPPVVAAPPRTAPEIVRPPVTPIEAKSAPKPPIVPPGPSAVSVRRAAQLRGAGLAALNSGNVSRSVALLRQAAALDHANPAIHKDLARALRIQATVAARR
jgi:hypothetical protein